MCLQSFNCPFCCNEKFQNINLLKDHIFSLVNSMVCPICNKKFDKILHFALHLGRDCDEKLPNLVEVCVNDSTSCDYQTETSPIFIEHNNSAGEDIHIVNVKSEIDETGSIAAEDNIEDEHDVDVVDESLLAKALLSGDVQLAVDTSLGIENTLQSSETEEETLDQVVAESESSQFFCQLCNMSLDSIEQHLENFHAGQEVLVQPECLEEMNMPEIEMTQVDIDSQNDTQLSDENSFYIIGDSSSIILPDNMQLTDTSKVKAISPFKEFAETISEEECLDKDGRVYTRKVIKIGQFWNGTDKDKPKLREPIIEKFIIDDSGKPKKITDSEENAIEDKNSIITLHICPICHLQYSELQNFHTHNCNMNATKRYICSECDSEFYGPRALCAHMKLHSKSKSRQQQQQTEKETRVGPFNCDYCGTQFRTFKSLRLHERMHQPVKGREIEAPVSYDSNSGIPLEEEREKFVCPLCNKSFDKQYESIHMNSHNAKILNFDCYICNRKLYTQANLDMHMKAHTDTKKFTCSHCKKPFVTYVALNEHMTQQCQKRQYECKYCGRRFARPHEKVKHERIHTGEKPHNCEVCGKSFRVSYCLTLHMRTHSGMRPYHCETCGKRFKSHSVYNHHLLTHSKERNYKCPFCPKAFKTSVQLAGHKNSHIKPFTCTDCNRPFASLYAVRTHMETHKRSNNLKFNCTFCGASYARTFALRDHMKEQHQSEMDKVSMDILQTEEDDGIEAATTMLAAPDDDILMDMAGGSSDSASRIQGIAKQ